MDIFFPIGSDIVCRKCVILPTTTQHPDVLAYTECDTQLIKVAPDDGLI
jgi:hypothetical protein